MRRKPLPPDTRPKWDDPDLECGCIDGNRGVPAEQQHNFSKYMMELSQQPGQLIQFEGQLVKAVFTGFVNGQANYTLVPLDWRHDPSYRWRKK